MKLQKNKIFLLIVLSILLLSVGETINAKYSTNLKFNIINNNQVPEGVIVILKFDVHKDLCNGRLTESYASFVNDEVKKQLNIEDLNVSFKYTSLNNEDKNNTRLNLLRLHDDNYGDFDFKIIINFE